jgi:hypothetical protein
MLHHGCHQINGEARFLFLLLVDRAVEEGQEAPRSTLEEPPP